MAVIPMPNIATINDRETWTTINNRVYTHPGIPGWEIVVDGPRTFAVRGLMDGIDGHRFGTSRTWDKAVALIAYLHGA